MCVRAYMRLCTHMHAQMCTHTCERRSRHTGIYLEEGLREGDGTPLQYSCLENPMDRGAW